MIRAKEKTLLSFEPENQKYSSCVNVTFISNQPSTFYDNTTKALVNSSAAEINDMLTVKVKDVAELYLGLSFIEKDKRFHSSDNVIGYKLNDVEYDNKVIHFFVSPNKPYTLQIKYTDYISKACGVLFIDITDLKFGYLLAHIRTVLSHYDIIPFKLSNVEYTYNKLTKDITIKAPDIITNQLQVYVIQEDAIELIKSIYHAIITRGLVWNAYFDSEHQVGIVNQKYVINGIKYDIIDFYKIGLLLTEF